MNKEQCQEIMSATCYLLDSNAGIEERLKGAGIRNTDLEKIKKALDLIYQVNQTYAKIQRRSK